MNVVHHTSHTKRVTSRVTRHLVDPVLLQSTQVLVQVLHGVNAR